MALDFYSEISNSFSVTDIAEPLTVFPDPDESLEIVYHRLMESQTEVGGSWFCIVRDGTRVLGFLAVDSEAFVDISGSALAKDGAEPLEINQIVAGSMRL